MSDSEIARQLANRAGEMLEGQPQEIVGAVVAELLASLLAAFPPGADRMYLLGKLTGAALKIAEAIDAKAAGNDG